MKAFAFFYLFLFTCLFSQKDSFKNVIEKINKKVQIPGGTFFLIHMRTGIEVFTNAPAIISRLEEMEKFQSCPYKIFLIKDDGELGENIYFFLKKNFNIDTGKYVKVIIDSKLYDLFGFSQNNSIYFIYRNQIRKKIDGKYENLLTDFNTSLVDVHKTEKKVYEWINRPPFIRTLATLIFPFNDTILLELADTQNDRIRFTDIRTGNVVKVLDLYGLLDYKWIYFYKFKNPLGISEEYFDKRDSLLRKIKRTPLRIENAQYVSENEIYLMGDFSVFHPSKFDFYVPSDFKKTIKVKKGSATTTSFATLLRVNQKFEITDTLILFNDDKNPNDSISKYFIQYTSSFILDGNNIYFPGYPYSCFSDSTYDAIFKKNKSYPFVYRFKKTKNNFLVFDTICLPLHRYPLEDFMGYDKYYFWKNTKGNIFICNGIYPDIYELHNKNSIYQIVDFDEIKAKYKLYKMTMPYNQSNPFKENIPFYVFSDYFYFDKKYLGLFYLLNNKLYIDFYNSDFKLIDRVELTKFIPEEHIQLFKISNVFPILSSQGLNYLIIKKGKVNLYQIKFKFCDVNPNVIKSYHKFE